MKLSTALATLSLFAAAACTPADPAEAADSGEATSEATAAAGVIDPNVASKEELAALPGMSDTIVDAMLGERPFLETTALDAFLAKHELDDAAREAFYGKAFVQLNLNTAEEDTFKLIPGVGDKMAHEFEEYRPWVSWAQFDKEIGKYVDADEVGRFKQYVFIPLDLNTATEDEFKTIPGVGGHMAHEFEEYRPWKSKAQFEKEIGKYVDDDEVARLWRYVTIGEAASE